MKHAAIRRVATSAVLIAGCGLAASGCSGSSSGTDASATILSANSTSPTATAATVSAGTTASLVSADDQPSGKATCDMLTPADVQFLMTDPAIGPTVSPISEDGSGQRCDFNNADVDQTVEVIVGPSSDPIFGYAAQKNSTAGAVPVSGVGNQAFRKPDDYDPTADGDGVTCSVSASIDDVPAAASLIVGGHSITLTSVQQDTVATAIGTVCNRVFGSGNTTPDLNSLHS